MDRPPDAALAASSDADPSVLAEVDPVRDRRRILLIDGLIALAVAAINLPLVLLLLQTPDANGVLTTVFDRTAAVMIVYIMVLVAPLTVRRLWPRASHLAVCAIYLIPLAPIPFGVELVAESATVFISLFSLAVTVRQPRTVAILSSITLIVLFVPVFGPVFYGGSWPDAASTAFTLPYTVLPLVLALILAKALRSERDQAERSQKEAIRVALASEAMAEEAAATERRRLAAELHDIVAHHVNLMVVQAESGPYLPKDTTAATTFATIASTGRTALGELDRLLGILRKEGDGLSGTAPIAPLPTLTDIPALVATAAQAGIPLRLDHFDVPPNLDAATAATAHRVVQECVTNVIKHADRTEPATVAITYNAATMRVDIRNRAKATPADRTGYGLISMRSRLEALGGTLDINEPDGWFHVAATLPLARSLDHGLSRVANPEAASPALPPTLKALS